MTAQNPFAGMFDPNALISRIFRRADNVRWDLMTGKTGVQTRDGIVTIEITEEDDGKGGKEQQFQTVINPIDGFGMAVPAFAQQTALDAVKVGDLILTHKEAGWVTKINVKSVSIIRPDGTHTTFTPPKTQILDFGTGVMVVRSLLNALPNGQAGLNNISGMLLPMMMMGGGDSGMMEQMLPMMLLMNGAGATAGTPDTANNPLANMGAQFSSMMPMLMAMQMFGGKNNSSSKVPAFRSPYFDNEDRPMFNK